MNLKVHVDLRAHFQPVVHQGARSICLPLTTTAAHELERFAGSGVAAHLAPEALWQHARLQRRAGPHGTTFHAINAAVNDWGQPALVHWPTASVEREESPPAAAGAPPWRLAVLESLRPGAESICDSLDRARPVVVGLEIGSEFDMADPLTGVIADPASTARAWGRHAVLAVGHGADESGRRHILIKNSWGLGWGAQGFGWITEAHLDSRTFQCAVVTPRY